MFDSLGKKLQNVARSISGQGTISEKNITDALRDVRLALLEADVHFKVVKDFVTRTREKALGSDVLLGLNPGQQFIKIVYDELVETMGGEAAEFSLDRNKQNIVMLLGLQGSGKTTFAAKLAKFLAKDKFSPMLVACDIYRPAAIKQLKTVGAQVNVPVYEMGTEVPVTTIVREAMKVAARDGNNVLIIDTAGRLHIDEMKMDELVALRDEFKPRFTFLVADAMTGQDAVNSAGAFHTQIGIDGVCLTKLDGDARGGAALSIKTVTGRPIYFSGMGERLDELEVFHPDRMASRILGMGDILTLAEKAQESFDEDEARALQKKFRKETYNFDDFLKQMKQVKRMGSISKILKFIPGMSQMVDQIDEGEVEKSLSKTEAIIHSMTTEEREKPELLNANRRVRIAKGSGSQVADINKLVKEFEMFRKMAKEMMSGGMMKAMGNMMGGGGDPAMAGGAPRMPRMPQTGVGKGKGKSRKELKKMGKKKSR